MLGQPDQLLTSVVSELSRPARIVDFSSWAAQQAGSKLVSGSQPSSAKSAGAALDAVPLGARVLLTLLDHEPASTERAAVTGCELSADPTDQGACSPEANLFSLGQICQDIWRAGGSVVINAQGDTEIEKIRQVEEIIFP